LIILMMDLMIISLGELLLPGDTFILSLITIITGGIATSLCTIKPFKNYTSSLK
jgi:hypothetical protein